MLVNLLIFSFIWHPGATGAPFLKLGIGARPVAMGSAFTAIADDGNAIFWNPAGLSLTSDFHLTVMAMDQLWFVKYFTMGSTIPLGRFGGLGFGGGYLYCQDIYRDEFGNEYGTFTNYDLLAAIGYGVNLGGKFYGGMSGKFLRSQLERYSANGVAADIGTMFKPTNWLYLGTALKHVGTPRRFISDWEFLPVNYRAGIGIKIPIFSHQITIGSDLSMYPDTDPTIGAGAELLIRGLKLTEGGKSNLAIRGGYRTGYHVGGVSGFSFGMGFEYELADNLYVGFDGLVLLYGYLGQSERLSFSLRFAPAPSRRHRSHRRRSR